MTVELVKIKFVTKSETMSVGIWWCLTIKWIILAYLYFFESGIWPQTGKKILNVGVWSRLEFLQGSFSRQSTQIFWIIVLNQRRRDFSKSPLWSRDLNYLLETLSKTMEMVMVKTKLKRKSLTIIWLKAVKPNREDCFTVSIINIVMIILWHREA